MKVICGVAALIIAVVSTTPQAARTTPYCGELITSYGPYDYTNADHRKNYLGIVERFHFTSDVEKLIKDAQGSLGGGINYTLITFPNHHRALASMAKLALREKTRRPAGATYSVECYFDRAMRLQPADGIVRVIYSDYLLKTGQTDKAINQLKEAINIQPENPTANYNLGLLYVQKKDYEQAKTYAKKAYELGFPLPGLKNKLVEAGEWED